MYFKLRYGLSSTINNILLNSNKINIFLQYHIVRFSSVTLEMSVDFESKTAHNNNVLQKCIRIQLTSVADLKLI